MKILITGSGGSTFSSILPQLEELNFEKIFLLDASEDIMLKHICDNKKYIFIKCPYGNTIEFKKFIKELILNENIEYCVPLVDEEIVSFYEIYKELDGIKGISIPKNIDFLKMVMDKKVLIEVLHKNKFSIPKLIDLNDKNNFQIIAKPKFGHGSKGIYYFNNGNQLKKFINCNIIDANDYVFQEKIYGTEYTVSVIPLEDKNIIVPKKVINKKGITMAAVTEKSEIIENLCNKIVKTFNPQGPFNVQLIIEEGTLEPKIFEINPRLSTTSILTYMAGIKELLLSLNLINSDENVGVFKENIYTYRYYDQIFVSDSDCKKVTDSLWNNISS